MIDLLPRRALLRFEIPIHYWDAPPRVDADLSKWPPRYLAPPLVMLEDAEPVADVYWAWNEYGFFAAFDVPNRPGRPHCDVQQWWRQDGLRLCIDTRDARDVKRGTRFCHFFYLLPLGGGRDGKAPVIGLHRMSRAKEHPPVEASAAKVASVVTARGWRVETHIPSACLHGWEPAEHPRIGVFYKIKDTRLGSQTLSVTDELGWNIDPSTWATGVLTRP
ncbi:MAG: hypothetical protein LC135_01575 [Phycisphaerae bacterium]|jgi:hypothetical protein|nr:hypothetical protein [Phycisphaerae bacterium]MCZ2398542.1 hypothetical protein [Phycisphaerae bacterium]